MKYYCRCGFVIAVMIYLSVFSGCASFHNNEIPKISNMAEVNQYQNRPRVHIDVKQFLGKPGSGSAREMKGNSKKLQELLQPILDEHKMFESYSFDKNSDEPFDYYIKLHVYNHGSYVTAFLCGFITGYTLGLIPTYSTDNYTLVTEIYDGDNRLIKDRQQKDSMKTWAGVWLLPKASETPKKISNEILENILRDTLNKMIEQKQLEYSELDFSLCEKEIFL